MTSFLHSCSNTQGQLLLSLLLCPPLLGPWPPTRSPTPPRAALPLASTPHSRSRARSPGPAHGMLPPPHAPGSTAPGRLARVGAGTAAWVSRPLGAGEPCQVQTQEVFQSRPEPRPHPRLHPLGGKRPRPVPRPRCAHAQTHGRAGTDPAPGGFTACRWGVAFSVACPPPWGLCPRVLRSRD